MPHLFETLKLADVELRNRIGISPMCQYCCTDGLAGDWQLVHLGSRAVGGAALVITEAAAVEPNGRITPGDLGIWTDEQAAALARIVRFVHGQGAVAGIQLAHAGRKSSHTPPWEAALDAAAGRTLPVEEGGWQVWGPSPVPFTDASPMPHEMSEGEIAAIVDAFAAAARRAHEAGFRWLELHGAHGYLMHNFHSPLSNRRTDGYGGSFDNRIRFTLEVVRAVRKAWPQGKVLALRISSTDWAEGGWTLEETVGLARRLKEEGVDLVDCSGGGTVPNAQIPIGPGYQVPFAETVRRDAGIPTAAVGLITEAAQADEIIRSGRADLVLLGRESLRDPYWPQHAAMELGHTEAVRAPVQYARAWSRANFRYTPMAVPAFSRQAKAAWGAEAAE